ncbi:prolyl oligopeptidase family serine peptidase [uncultured Paludibaculum sp.]|uniref:alpha/beta hydrolase family protein n=1 Tax=uncultured Paludibaculum sp. TaxID=1765020 RepID=UPI002AAB6B37|nr:prolyl oligopeptidase family serine peptidase [uncultured Paludibaculum sp.]
MAERFRSSAPRVFTIALFLTALAFAQGKRPILHKDFDAWRSISGQVLSHDGKYLAYAYMPQDGDGDVVVRELATGKEWRENVGALPPPAIVPVDVETPPPPRTVKILFTSDGQYLVAQTYPAKAATEQAKKARKKPEEMPKQGLLIVKLGSAAPAARVDNVKSFQVPSKGGPWVAYLKEVAATPAAAAKPTEQDSDDEDQGRSAGSRASASGKKEFGTDLVLRDLTKTESAERTFASVSEYTIARDGATLVYAVSSKKEEENGAYAVSTATNSAPAALASGKGKYSKLTWSREQDKLAFLFDTSAMLWDGSASKAVEVVAAQTAGLPDGMVVSEKGAVGFSRDGKRMYVPVAPPAKPEKSEPAPADERVVMDLWRWNDDLVQPMQKVRANQERNRTYRGVYDIAGKKYVQLATPSMQVVVPTDDGLGAVGLDDRPWRSRIDYDSSYQDVYFVDGASGQRTLLLRQLPGGGGPGGSVQIAPDGKHAFYYNTKAWHLMTLPDGASINATSSLGVAFFDEEDDTPNPPGSYGHSGWAKDSQSFFVNDRYDVWQMFVDGRPARNLTSGEGRKAKIQFRVQRVDAVDEEADRGLDSTKPFTFRAESEDTRDTGFYRVTGLGTPQRLLWGPKNYRFVTRAKEADAVLITAARFDEFPDLHWTNVNFTAPKKVTNGGAQMEPFLWGKGELLSFRNTDGVPLRAALYKPANFDPKKKYPMIVYIYEKLSQGVNTFVEPRPGHSINFSQYTSQGYVILTPDIVYTIGNPGHSALKCVLPAVQTVVDMGFIDEKKIGIQGHSWGGYQIAYMVTQTNRFRAAEAGAPVGNMTSAYSGIRWGSGQPRQFQYEKTQSRIGPSLYDNPLKYVENSPIFQVKRVETPLLILHDDNDDAVPWYQGIEFFLALRRTGKEAYLMNYNGELHGLRRRPDQKDYAIRMQQFFDHFLKDAPAPEWMEKGIPYVDREDEKERFEKATDQR